MIRSYDLATGALRDHEKADWDLLGTGYSRDGRYRVSMVNHDGSVVEGAAEKPVALPKLPRR